jgi:hypothetical protein
MPATTEDKTPDPANRTQDGLIVAPLRQLPSGSSVSISLAQTPPEPAKIRAGPDRIIKGYFRDKLEDAERLLGYAAEAGIEVDATTRNDVLKARFESDGAMGEQATANLLSALTTLAVKMRPVTAESLKARLGQKPARDVTRFYVRFAIFLMVIIVPYSIVAFVSSGLSEKIGQDIDTANALAVKLTDELEPPDPKFDGAETRGLVKALPSGLSEKDVIKDLQQFTIAMRSIDSRAKALSFATLSHVDDRLTDDRKHPDTMRTNLELPTILRDLPAVARAKIKTYQDIRFFAQNTRETVALTTAAIANHLLPMLYALLGACAFLARSLEEQMRTRPLAVADRHTVHFLIAGIGGFIVGLFTSFSVTQGVALSPLALAFLVGYSVDTFFSFLESFLQIFTKGRSSSTPQPGPGAKSNDDPG